VNCWKIWSRGAVLDPHDLRLKVKECLSATARAARQAPKVGPEPKVLSDRRLRAQMGLMTPLVGSRRPGSPSFSAGDRLMPVVQSSSGSVWGQALWRPRF
jgi:hypothetical protein